MPTQDVGSFTYLSQPHSAPQKTNKNKEHNEALNGVTLTLMSDPRVVRGNTHSLVRKVTKYKEDFVSSKKNLPGKANNSSFMQNRPTYVYEVKPFSTEEANISNYLEERNNFPRQTKEINIQTNEFNTRAETPEYVPRKTGIDRSTQVEDVKELFDFDKEVLPILNLIVEKTLEQAVFEVKSEEELISLEATYKKFSELKAVDEKWMKDREDLILKRFKNTQAKVQELEDSIKYQYKTKSMVASLQMMKQITPSIIDKVLSDNFNSGLWKEYDETMIENEIMPQVIHDTLKRKNAHATATNVVDELLQFTQNTFDQKTKLKPNKNLTEKLTIYLKFTPLSTNEEKNVQEQKDEENDNNTEKNETANKKKESSTVISINVLSTDSIKSIENTIKTEIIRRKTQENIPAEDLKLLPEVTYNFNLKKHLSGFVQTNVFNSSTDIAMDAILFNFSFPTVIYIDMPIAV